MKITNDQTTFGAYFTQNSNFRKVVQKTNLCPYTLELTEKFRKLPDHEVEILNLTTSQNPYFGDCEIYNKTTGAFRTIKLRFYEQLESILSFLLETSEGKDFFKEDTLLAKITKGLTTPQTINEKLDM